MGKDVYTQVVRNLAEGCMGLRYAYFSQDMLDGDAMERDFAILGDFKGKDGNPWKGGICFGLSVLYLACCTPTGRSTWKTPEALMSEFADALSGTNESAGMLRAIAQAYVRQKGASIMRRGDMENPMVLECKGCSRQYALGTAMTECSRCGSESLVLRRLRQEEIEGIARLHDMTVDEMRVERYEDHDAKFTSPLLQKSVQAYRANELKGSAIVPELDGKSDKLKHAIRDQLVANFGLKPSPRHGGGGVRRNYECISLEMEEADDFDYKNHLKASDVQALISFVGEKNTFSLFGFERLFVGGHQMAFWSDGSRTHFFDPNLGVVSFSWQRGLKTFLSRYLPFRYYWKGTTKGEKKSSVFMRTSTIEFRTLSWTTLDFDVYRYSTA
ncbi:MAG: YopT-type cysteine protease domain-containing protein [Pseudomonadota bacterium]